MRGKLRILIVLILIIIPMSNALITINPQKFEIRKVEFNKPYNVIITVINPDSNTYDVQVMPSKDSYYLLDNIKIEPTNFKIGPNDKKNIKLTLTLPNTLSPEEHILFLNFLSLNHELGKFKLSFSIPGEKIENLTLKNIKINDQKTNDILYFDYQMENYGTIIARGSPIIEIYKDDQLIEKFGQESNIIIMPKKDYNLSIMYDTTKLNPGNYKYVAKFRYNDLESNYHEGKFKITQKKNDEIEEKEVIVGENLDLDLTIKNPSKELSFYKISYNIFDQNIGDTVEGQMQNNEKEINLNIDTSNFELGIYDLEIEIKTGKNLENTDMKKIKINVINEKNSLLNNKYLLGIIVGIISIGIISFAIYKLYPKIIQNNTKSKVNNLHEEIRNINKGFSHLELSMNHFTHDIHKFINESNSYLRSKGYDNYEFR
jgi:hypothetical protein